jgi:hypothetical protein
MRRTFWAFLLLAPLSDAGAEGEGEPVSLYNVSLEDAIGNRLDLVAFHRVSGPDRFQGYVGTASVEVPYGRLREVRVFPPAARGGRMRARLTLLSGNEVEATFDHGEREARVAGFWRFGRASLAFGDVRVIRFAGRTERADLPDFGPPAPGVDARLTDAAGVTLEVAEFRRSAGTNAFRLMHGAALVEVPVRIVRFLRIGDAPDSGRRRVELVLADGAVLQAALPAYEEAGVYRAEAEFGALRIHLGDVRELRVHRPTPALRDLAGVSVEASLRN